MTSTPVYLRLVEPADSWFLPHLERAAEQAGLHIERVDLVLAESVAGSSDERTVLGVGPSAADAPKLVHRIRDIAPDTPLLVFLDPRAVEDASAVIEARVLAAECRAEAIPLGEVSDTAARLRDVVQRSARTRRHRAAVSQIARQLSELSGRGDDDTTVAAGSALADYYLTAVLAQASDAIVSTDANGMIVTWNAGAELLFGFAAEDAIGRGIGLLQPTSMPEGAGTTRLEVMILRVLRDHVPEQADVTCRCAGGGSVDVALSLAPIRDTGGSFLGITFIARDVSERRRVELALREANRQKDEFLATVSHELRTPLTAIIGYTDLLLRGIAGPLPDRTSSYVGQVRAAGDRLLSLVNALLDYSRLEARTEPIKLQSIDLTTAVQRAVEQVTPEATNKAIHMRTATPRPGTLLVRADEEKLRRLLDNYLSNAIKFTRPNGEVAVALEPDPEGPGMVRVNVSDTGIGLAQDQLDRIWDRFYQVDSSLTREHGGMGLGLAIVRHLAELQGGRVGVKSGGLGQGSTFWVALPLAEADGAQQPGRVPTRRRSTEARPNLALGTS